MSVRAVYDCMIFLQAASNPNRVHTTFRLLDSGDVTLFTSDEVLAEIRDVLARPGHAQKFPSLTVSHISNFLAAIAAKSTLIDEVPSLYTVNRDPKDSKYVNLALAANAQFLVTWDQHLLKLMDEKTPEGAEFFRQFPTLRILDPVALIAAIAATKAVE